MSQENIELSLVVDFIFNQINEEPTKNYDKAVSNILKALDKVLDQDFSETTNFLQIFSALKILLKLYEKQCVLNDKKADFSSFGSIYKSILEILNCDQESFISNNQLQKDLLQIVHSLSATAFMQGPEGIQELIKFYSDILNRLTVSKESHEAVKVGCVLKLKIICALYEVLSAFNNFSIVKNELNELGFKEKECNLFAHYLLYGPDEVAIQTLLFVVPQYMNLMKTNDIIKVIWSEISAQTKLKSLTLNYKRIMIIMCHLFDFCSENKEFDPSMVMIHNDGIYWNLIQFCLTEKNQILRKQALYLFKKSVNYCKNSDLKLNCKLTESLIFYWESSLNEKLYNIYSEIIVILEFLEEQQIHIIKPIFQKVDDLIYKNCENLLDQSWILIVHKKALMHESTQVVKWGVKSLLMLPENFFSDDYIVISLITILIPALSNINLYYNDGLNISDLLINFFKKIMRLNAGKLFSNLFIEAVCNLNWSPQALFFVVHALANSEKHLFWSEKEISVIKRFVKKAFETFDEAFSYGIQDQFLKSIMKLTNENAVSLENISLLLHNFSVLTFKNGVFYEIVDWLKISYSKEEAKKLLEKFKSGDLSKEFNEKCLSIIFILFQFAFEDSSNEQDCFVKITLLQLLMNFKNSDKRVYCDKTVHNYYLSVICNILDKSPKSMTEFMYPFFKDIVGYILLQVKLISSLKDFEAGQLYVKTFQNILDADFNDDKLHNFYSELFNIFEVYFKECKSVPSIQIHFVIKFLSFNFKSSPMFRSTEQFDMFFLFLLKKVNEGLTKDQSSFENTRDFQVLWGKINSEFLESKWKIFNFLIYNQEFLSVGAKEKLQSNEINKICGEALNVGGYGVLLPVMSALKKLILEWNAESESFHLIDLTWKLIMEKRKSDDFQHFINMFVQMLFQKEVFMKSETLQNKIFEFANLIFQDSSLIVIDAFVRYILNKPITEDMISFFCEILGKTFLFGSVQKKDERLSIQVYSYIREFSTILFSQRITANDIRARAVDKIRKLDKNNPTDLKFAENLAESLIKMEKESTNNKARYFGDSHVHRVKHRLMQTLLLLEPFLHSNQEFNEKLINWLYQSLMKENPQPSVKYQQEWLLIRILIKCEKLLNSFWDYFSDSFEKKAKGLCSLIAISYHLCILVSSDLTSSWIDKAITTLLPFCMDQHFEIRLYSQVILEKLYSHAVNKNLTEIVTKYKMVYESILESITRGCKGNAAKNCMKLQKDFYLTVFHPLRHYSLKTIYWDLPRLSNIGLDEWISIEKFKELDETEKNVEIMIPLENEEKTLETVDSAKWLVEKSHQGIFFESQEPQCEIKMENFQKKMIPTKPLVPDWEQFQETDNKNFTKDGLIVVASLIDRIPNLGGLARTCEIFGASEYVINSLKYIEDKQFTSLSVTAEKWISVKEVKMQNLLEYLMEKKQEGYVVIGAEQALYSQPLSSVKFPKKSLFLLGNEKEGIPPNLLPLLDICVEVPQIGIIRSLNVHVTGALFIWEYAKQNYFSLL